MGLLPALLGGPFIFLSAFLAGPEALLGEALEAFREVEGPMLPSFSPLLLLVTELPSSAATTVKSAFSLESWYSFFSCGRLVADFQSLSSRMRVQRGKRMEMPSAVWASALENSAPVISQTGAFFGSGTMKSG